ncbi:MAG: alpha/beta hydrolase fold domain-containing protein [Nocardioides sp.]
MGGGDQLFGARLRSGRDRRPPRPGPGRGGRGAPGGGRGRARDRRRRCALPPLRPAQRRDGDRSGAIVFAHGGGFVFGEVATHDARSRRLANRTGRAVLAVDYRLAPEHRFPAASDDVSTAGRWLAEHATGLGLDPGRLVSLGDSAGAASRSWPPCALPDGTPPACSSTPSSTRGAAVRRSGSRTPTGSATRRRPGTGAPTRETTPGSPACWTTLRSARSTHPGWGPAADPGPRRRARHPARRGPAARRPDRRGRGLVETVLYPGMIHGFWGNTALFDAAEESYADTAAFLGRVLGLPST